MCYFLSCIRLFATPWTGTRHAPLSIEFPRQEYWSGLPFPSPGDLPNPGIKPGLLHCRQILYHLSHQGSLWTLEWVACPFSRGSSLPRNRTRVSCIAGGFFTSWATREAQIKVIYSKKGNSKYGLSGPVPRLWPRSLCWLCSLVSPNSNEADSAPITRSY